jgi:hypothetical protein
VRQPRIELEPSTPWSLRLFDRIPLPAFWAGVVFGLGVFALFLLYTAAFGAAIGRHADVSFERGWLAEAIQDFFTGFTIAVIAASVRSTRAEVEALRPALGLAPPDEPGLEREVLRYRRLPLALMGSVGLVSAYLTVLSPELWVGGRMPGWTHPTVLWLAVRNAVTWWIALRGVALELMLGRRVSRLADRVQVVDLFDRTAFAPFTRRALRSVLLWMMLAMWVSLTYIGPGALGGLLTLGVVGLACFALAAFVIPLIGPHQRLRELQQRELERVRTALRATRDALLAPDAPPFAGGRLADLIAYETRVEAASTWPIEASTLPRFSLYLALGLGSWIGAGLVQHAVESALR